MLKKILTIGIWLVLFLSVVYAGDNIPGLYVTLVDQEDEYITYHRVDCEIIVPGGTYYDWGDTNSAGLVKLGFADDVGVYILSTTFENHYYTSTVYKASGQQFYTWKIGLPHDPE